MNYKVKYLKYKKMYLKNKYQLKGGFNQNIDYNKFILMKNPKEYDILIDRFNNFCNLNFSKDNQQTNLNNLESIYKELGPEILTNLGIYNFFIDKSFSKLLANSDIKSRMIGLCNQKEKIINNLQNEKNLQNKFIEQLKDVPAPYDRKFNIKDYIEFAKKNNLLDKNLEDVYTKYAEYLKNQEVNEDLIKNFMILNEEKKQNFAASLNGNQCISDCKIHTPLLGNKYCYCDTIEYKTLTGTKKWDYCKEEQCKQ